MRANEYALNSSAYGAAAASMQQALRTHLEEAAELVRKRWICTRTILSPKCAGSFPLHVVIAPRV